MAQSTNVSATLSLDTVSRRLLERVAKALEEANQIAKAQMEPRPSIFATDKNPKDETHS